MNFLLVGVGGALGAIVRYKLSDLNSYIPYGTFICNLIGSFLIGFFFFFFSRGGFGITESAKPLVISGFLGALTTFSTFSLELFFFYEKEDYQSLLLYLCLNIIICFSAVVLGKKLVDIIV